MFIESLLLLCSLIFLLIYVANSHPPGFPPGYLSFPILGHLPYISRSRGVHKLFQKWGKQLGPLFSVNIASYPAVVVSDLTLIRHILGKNELSGGMCQGMSVEPENEMGGILHNAGEDLTSQRMFTIMHLKEKSSKLESIIKKESDNLIGYFKSNQNQLISIKKPLKIAVLNTLWSLIAGQRFDMDDDKAQLFISLIERNSDRNPFEMLTFAPILAKFFPNKSGWNSYKKNTDDLMGFIKEYIVGNESSSKNDLIDSYLKEFAKTNSKFCREKNLLNLIRDLLICGIEPTAISLEWIFLLIAQNPEIQRKIFQEIKGKDGVVSFKDIMDRFPYTQAVVKEGLRIVPVVPLGEIRHAQDDIQLDQFYIPKETLIIPNFYAAHHDQDFWGDPEIFKPERENLDKTIPWSFGKRICIGNDLAELEIIGIIVNILGKFEISLNGMNESVLKEYEMKGGLCHPKEHKLIFTNRVQKFNCS